MPISKPIRDKKTKYIMIFIIIIYLFNRTFWSKSISVKVSYWCL